MEDPVNEIEIVVIPPEKAKELAYSDEFKKSYAIMPMPLGYVGYNLNKEFLNTLLLTAQRIEIAGPKKFKTGYGIAVLSTQDKWYFIRHDKCRMKKYLEEVNEEALQWITQK